MADRYSTGKIYKLQCNDGHYYIGSTISKLAYRLNNHKQASKIPGGSRVYQHINTIGFNNVKIILLEDYACRSSSELKAREDYHIQQAKDACDIMCLNLNRAFVSAEERKETMKDNYENNKEERLAYAKEYRDSNKEKIAEYKSFYRQAKADKIREYNHKYVAANVETVRERKKQYNAKNKEKMAAYFKQYAAEHKDKIDAYKNEWSRRKRAEGREDRVAKRQLATAAAEAARREILTCECGGTYQPYRKSRHEESKRHIKYLTSAKTY